jgi:hypothetical protein
MEMLHSKKKEEGLKNNRTHSGQQFGVTDKTRKTPSPGSSGMRILSRHPITIDIMMKAVEIACI